MSFQQGLSGLSTAAKALDATSNNISNASTVGFKGANVNFGDVFASSMSGGGGAQVGIGSFVGGVAQQFSQGSITTTNNPLDIAINGTGFFRMSNDGAVSYTRNGQFHLDKEGFVINDQSYNLTGHPTDTSGIINTAIVSPLQLTADKLKLNAVATGASTTLSGVEMSVNLDSRSAGDKIFPAAAAILNASGTAAAAGESVSISPTSYDYSTALTVYDSLGNAHSLSYYFVKDSTAAGAWNVFGNVDGKMTAATDVPSLDSTKPIKLAFGSNGSLDTVTTPNATIYHKQATDPTQTTFWNNIPLSFTVPDASSTGATATIATKFNLTGTTQFGSANATNQLRQDGYTSGNLAGVGVDANGVISGRYTNGQSFNIGQVVLADFKNPNGLSGVGGNQWVETSASGAPTVSEPGTGIFGVLQASATEDSNVDLTQELVDLITQQRNYQANAQSIKTQDQVLQTLVNLK
jgi:flagellar hook protein FlgE